MLSCVDGTTNRHRPHSDAQRQADKGPGRTETNQHDKTIDPNRNAWETTNESVVFERARVHELSEKQNKHT